MRNPFDDGQVHRTKKRSPRSQQSEVAAAG
jgi:hypothetical protein